MKCIRCQRDSKYSERSDGACPGCRGAFALEPQKGDKLTDGAFQAAIDRVSSGAKVRWTTEHLYYEVARRFRRTWTVSLVFVVLSMFPLLALLVFQYDVIIFLSPIFWLIGFLARPTPGIRLTRAEFHSMWTRWLAAHGEAQALIVKKALPPAAENRPLPTDIHAYSFDRAVICDRAETVDLLLANNFHFENNCAVLSIDGYPQHAFQPVRAMLRNNPRLVVFALHDATVDGCLLARRLATEPEWFGGGGAARGRVIDVGLGPAHAGPFKGCWQEQPSIGGSPIGSPMLSSADNRWLGRYFVELAVIRPEQVIKRLFRAISGADAATQIVDSGGGWYVDSTAFSADASASDGGGDSFG